MTATDPEGTGTAKTKEKIVIWKRQGFLNALFAVGFILVLVLLVAWYFNEPSPEGIASSRTEPSVVVPVPVEIVKMPVPVVEGVPSSKDVHDMDVNVAFNGGKLDFTLTALRPATFKMTGMPTQDPALSDQSRQPLPVIVVNQPQAPASVVYPENEKLKIVVEDESLYVYNTAASGQLLSCVPVTEKGKEIEVLAKGGYVKYPSPGKKTPTYIIGNTTISPFKYKEVIVEESKSVGIKCSK